MKNSLTRGLRFKITFSLIVFIFIVIGCLTIVNIINLKKNILHEVDNSSKMMADTLMNGIRHPMAVNDTRSIKNQLLDINKNMAGVEVYIFDFNQQIIYASEADRTGSSMGKQVADGTLSNGLKVMLESGKLDQEVFQEKDQGKPVLTILRPILNEAGCYHCHGQSRQILGGMMIRTDVSAAYDTVNQARMINILIGIVSIVLTSAFFFLIIGWMISKPLVQTIAMVREVAEGEGDLTKRLHADRRDELGELAAGINIFIENLQKMLRRMVRGVESLSKEAESLESLAGQQADGADQMAGKANGVATAAEEMNSNMNTVAAAMEQASTNVSTVASGTEEMSATIGEIAKNAETAKEITDQAVVQGKSASERINELGKAADEIGQVTETINAISSQTNLLALNATIEAARAGEAGKGFAVVANEIKDLAQQTAAATGEIAAKIKGIQDSTGATVTEINEIARINREVDDIVSTISTAVEEQASTTTEIAENITQASSGLGEVNENIAQTSEVSGSIAQEIAEVNETAGSMSNASAQVRQSAEELRQLSVELDGLMSRFKL